MVAILFTIAPPLIYYILNLLLNNIFKIIIYISRT